MFQVIHDFDANTYRGVCAVSGRGKREAGLGVQPHEVDAFVLRGPEIEVYGESYGHFDIRPSVLREIAIATLDLVPASALEDAEGHRHDAEVLLEDARDDIARLRDLVDGLTVENARFLRAAQEASEPLPEPEAPKAKASK